MKQPTTQNDNNHNDCTTCKHGGYNDYWECYLCYKDDCVDWNKWEQKEKDNNAK